MVWPIMEDACRRSIHLKDGVEASQRFRSSGRSAPSSTFAFEELTYRFPRSPLLDYFHCFRHSPEMYLIAGTSRVMGLHRLFQIGRRLRLAIYRQPGCSFCGVLLKQVCVGSGQWHPNSIALLAAERTSDTLTRVSLRLS